MAKVFEGIDERLAAWIAAQRLFFVATAPSAGGHVNVSPKGPIDTLSVVGPDRVSDSCGYGVPLMTFEAHRPQTAAWAQTKLRKEGPGALERYVEAKNARSIDGLPAFDG